MTTKCSCIDCQVYRGEFIPVGGIIYQDALWVLNHAAPKVLGHLILKPIEHYTSVSEMPDSLAVSVGPMFKKINSAIQSVCSPEKIYIAAFGDAFPYLHWHFFPRYKNMPTPASASLMEFDKGVYSCSVDEVTNVAKEIRLCLKAE